MRPWGLFRHQLSSTHFSGNKGILSVVSSLRCGKSQIQPEKPFIGEGVLYCLRARILVRNFTVRARNSKPESLLSRTSSWYDRHTYIIWDTWSTHWSKTTKGALAVYLLTGGSWQFQPDFILRWREENQSLRASDLVWNSMFNARSSKPDYVLARLKQEKFLLVEDHKYFSVTIRLMSFDDAVEKNRVSLLCTFNKQ